MAGLSTNIGLQSLLAAQAGLETIGHNLANASTPGYSRQTLHASAAEPYKLRGLLMGSGIQTDVVKRTVDTLVQMRIVRQTSSLGRLDARLAAMTEVEAFLGTAGDLGVHKLLADFFGGLSTLSGAPEDGLLRTGAVQRTDVLARELNQLTVHADSLRRDTRQDVEATVEQVNALARRIGDLNFRIQDTEFGTLTANDLRDQRDEAIRQLSELADVKVIEAGGGAVRVLIGGGMLVSPTAVETLSVQVASAGAALTFHLGDLNQSVAVSGGKLGGLAAVLQDFLPRLGADLDDFARNLILETNRVHSTGIAGSGPFAQLAGGNPFQDVDGDGAVQDELLANAGLPFEIASGELYVNVTDLATQEVSKHRLDVDAARTKVSDLVGALNALPQLSAWLDGENRLQVSADVGFGFDFSARLDQGPDDVGSFGSGKASLSTQAEGPFALADGDTLDLLGPAGSFTITLNAASFFQISQATAQELAAVINADPLAQANGLAAGAVGERLVLQTSGSGSAQSFTVAGGSALPALGWTGGTAVAGHDASVDVGVSGEYTGASNGILVFKALVDGTVGTTPGLLVQVLDETGAQVAQLDLGAGYVPGEELEVVAGVRASFGLGTLSASHGDVFQLDLVADADTSDVLPAVGLNGLFTGTDAESIALAEEIRLDPSRLAAGTTPAAGDGSNLLRLIALDHADVAGLGGITFGERFADIAAGVGLEISGASGARETEQLLLDSLEARRDQVSGVNVDEELVHMIEQEQAYAAAAQYLRVINDVTAELMNIL